MTGDPAAKNHSSASPRLKHGVSTNTWVRCYHTSGSLDIGARSHGMTSARSKHLVAVTIRYMGIISLFTPGGKSGHGHGGGEWSRSASPLDMSFHIAESQIYAACLSGPIRVTLAKMKLRDERRTGARSLPTFVLLSGPSWHT